MTYTGKKITVINRNHTARKGTKRQKGMDIILSSKTTNQAIPRLTKIGANTSFIAFAVRSRLIKLAA